MTTPHSRTRRLFKAARWLIGAGIVWLIAERLNGVGLREILARIHFGWIFAAAAVEACRILAGAASMRLMLGAFGLPPAFRDVLCVNLRGAFFAVAADWIGTVVRWGGMVTQLGVSSTVVLAAILWETGFVWIIAYGLNWFLLPTVSNMPWSGAESRIYMTFLLCVGPLLALFAVFWIWWVKNPRRMLEAVARRTPDIAGLRKRMLSWASVSVRIEDLTFRRNLAAGGFLFLQFLCSSAVLCFLAHAVEAPLDLKAALWICAFVILVQSLPVAVLGWAFRVGILVVLLPKLEAGNAEQAAVIGVCGGLVNLLGPAAGSVEFFLNLSGRKVRQEKATS